MLILKSDGYRWRVGEELARLADKESADRFYTVLSNRSMSQSEQYQQAFTEIKNAELSESSKLYLMVELLKRARNIPEVRENLLERFREETGFQNFEREQYQEQTHILNQEENGKGLCSVLDEKSKNITAETKEKQPIGRVEKTTELS